MIHYRETSLEEELLSHEETPNLLNKTWNSSQNVSVEPTNEDKKFGCTSTTPKKTN